jgi:hypothetical protein
VQQPVRARMCGFGDKVCPAINTIGRTSKAVRGVYSLFFNFQQDRRPITPPPCIRLIITDVHTGKEVDCK